MINYDDHDQTWFYKRITKTTEPAECHPTCNDSECPWTHKDLELTITQDIGGFLSYNECLLARDIHLATTGEAL